MVQCLYCGLEIPIVHKDDKRKRFCNQSCSAKYNNPRRPPMTEETKSKIRSKVSGRRWSEEQKREIGIRTASAWKDDSSNMKKGADLARQARIGKIKLNPDSILELSGRTQTKILTRLGLGCSRCGWREATCDIHHIEGRKIENPDHHSNLTYLCPNCHRMAHNNKIPKGELMPLADYFPKNWTDFYYV